LSEAAAGAVPRAERREPLLFESLADAERVARNFED
jgi:hypothetical protein